LTGYPLQFLARPDPTAPPPPIFYLGPIRAPLHLVLLKRLPSVAKYELSHPR